MEFMARGFCKEIVGRFGFGNCQSPCPLLQEGIINPPNPILKKGEMKIL